MQLGSSLLGNTFHLMRLKLFSVQTTFQSPAYLVNMNNEIYLYPTRSALKPDTIVSLRYYAILILILQRESRFPTGKFHRVKSLVGAKGNRLWLIFLEKNEELLDMNPRSFLEKLLNNLLFEVAKLRRNIRNRFDVGGRYRSRNLPAL